MTYPELVPQLKELATQHAAGSAVEPQRIWTSRSTQSFADELTELGNSVCANTISRLLRDQLGLSRRKMEKTLSMGESADREAQFERPGQAWTDSRLPAWDHDFPSSSWGQVIPYGVYDLAANEAFVYLAQGADTGELACDAIRRWQVRLGKRRYDETLPVLLLADCGGSNGYRVPLFRQHLYQLSQLWSRSIRVCHLPPYCSKYNPIDHRLFCHLSRSL